MSADNGIYIGKFPEGYRVIHAQSIDNLNYYPYLSKEYIEMLKVYFKDSKIFKSKKKAIMYAIVLSNKIDILEYGICDLGVFPSFKEDN